MEAWVLKAPILEFLAKIEDLDNRPPPKRNCQNSGPFILSLHLYHAPTLHTVGLVQEEYRTPSTC